ncbi:MAG: thiamine pyrophosphate-binding protein [Rhodospirillales bacterium]|nr:thiamine pyrophosphate-binding protein [Rhodospirillales bacterium]
MSERNPRPTVAQGLVAALEKHGVRRLFGVPGGGSSLDVIEAASDRGMEFILAKGETSAAIMAAVTAELSGAPGVILTGVGPGAASAVNGIAYAALERAPVLLITDCFEDTPGLSPLHQRFDQESLYAPLVKGYRRLSADGGASAIKELLQTALDQPQGPVHIDLSTQQAAAPLADGGPGPNDAPPPAEADLTAARTLLANANRPVIVAGLQAREAPAAAALATLVTALECPVLATYKAKGVFPENDRRCIGLFTGATAEADCISGADLIIFFGLDPIELIPQAWRLPAPVLDLSPVAGQPHPVEPTAAVAGPLALSVGQLADGAEKSDWTDKEMAALRDGLRHRLAMEPSAGRNAQALVEAVDRAAPPGVRLCVDSGAHMFSAMAFSKALAPYDMLKSNGLSTMGYALPAAIASALQEPVRPVVAMTGDGGLMMCLSELVTAVRLNLGIVVVVFNDAALSLIDIKQQRQQRQSLGVRYPAVDLAAAARGLGCRAWQVDEGTPLEPILAEAFAGTGPAVIDVAVDPAGYGAQMASLRG